MPMQETLKRRATYADLEAVAPNLVAEILNGVLVTHPRPPGRNSRVHFRLGAVLGNQFEDDEDVRRPAGWVFLTEPELHLGEDVTVPELAGWRIERLPPPPSPDPLDPVKITLTPDWVCEVLSRTTEVYDRGEKRDIYAAAGIRHLWLVDPRIEQIEAFELSGARWSPLGIHSGKAAVRIAPFDALEIDLGRVWPSRRSGGRPTSP